MILWKKDLERRCFAQGESEANRFIESLATLELSH